MASAHACSLNGIQVPTIDAYKDPVIALFVLEAAGAVVTAADSVEAAKTLFSTHPPQLVVSDLAMPALTGYDSCNGYAR